MAIDGRMIGKTPPEKDPYNSAGIGLVAQALFWVPVLLIVVFAYWSGSWMGGWVWGVVSVLSTALTIAVLWLLQRRKRHR